MNDIALIGIVLGVVAVIVLVKMLFGSSGKDQGPAEKGKAKGTASSQSSGNKKASSKPTTSSSSSSSSTNRNESQHESTSSPPVSFEEKVEATPKAAPTPVDPAEEKLKKEAAEKERLKKEKKRAEQLAKENAERAANEAKRKEKEEKLKKIHQEEQERLLEKQRQKEAREKEEADRREKAELEKAEAKKRAEEKALVMMAAKAKRDEEEKIRLEEEKRKQEEADRRSQQLAAEHAKRIADMRMKDEAEKRAKEEAIRKAKEEAELHAKEQARLKAKEEADRRALVEAEKKAKLDAEKKARAEAKAKEAAERKAKEDAERKAKEEEAERRAKEEAAVQKAKEEVEQALTHQVAQRLSTDIVERLIVDAEGDAVAQQRPPLNFSLDAEMVVEGEEELDTAARPVYQALDSASPNTKFFSSVRADSEYNIVLREVEEPAVVVVEEAVGQTPLYEDHSLRGLSTHEIDALSSELLQSSTLQSLDYNLALYLAVLDGAPFTRPTQASSAPEQKTPAPVKTREQHIEKSHKDGAYDLLAEIARAEREAYEQAMLFKSCVDAHESMLERQANSSADPSTESKSPKPPKKAPTVAPTEISKPQPALASVVAVHVNCYSPACLAKPRVCYVPSCKLSPSEARIEALKKAKEVDELETSFVQEEMENYLDQSMHAYEEEDADNKAAIAEAERRKKLPPTPKKKLSPLASADESKSNEQKGSLVKIPSAGEAILRRKAFLVYLDSALDSCTGALAAQPKLFAEFRSITEGMGASSSIGQKHMQHNRYRNIFPYDHSRVSVPTTEHNEMNDYINANYIPGHDSDRAYIATQAPLPSTFYSFWLMVWSHNVDTVLMVANEKEGGVAKCDKYWPDTFDYLGDLEVVHTSTQKDKSWIRRELILKYQGEQRIVKQLQFTGWPDHGVPSSAADILAYRDAFLRSRSRSKGPVVVHCSAGVGRTGTFIAIDRALHAVDAQQSFSVLDIVRSMRANRTTMVQTEGQYQFIFKVLHEAMTAYKLQVLQEISKLES